MGHQELLLVLVSVVLFSLMTARVNTNLAEGSETLQEMEIEQLAISVAQQFIEDAKSKRFDEWVGVIDPVNMPDDFTSPFALGSGGGEVYPNFDDVDDYHGFNQTVYVQDLDFTVTITVAYVQDISPETAVLIRTYFKKMTVTVSSEWLSNSITLKHTLIGSAVIGGLVMMSMGRFTNDVTEDLYLSTMEDAAYGNMTDLAQLLEFDFSRIGLGVNDPQMDAVTPVDSTDLTFYLDRDDDGTIDSIRYYLGDLASAASTENPRDKILYRVVNGSSEEHSVGLTDFEVKYYDKLGNETTDPDLIKTFEVNLEVESPYVYDGQHPTLVWRGRFTPPNLVVR
jgi:hypothetical protein